LNSSRRIDKQSLRALARKSVSVPQPAEILIADTRAGLTPANIVEQRFQALLLRSSLGPGTPQFGLSRLGGHTKRTIAYASLGEEKESASRREANLDQGESTMYAISILGVGVLLLGMWAIREHLPFPRSFQSDPVVFQRPPVLALMPIIVAPKATILRYFNPSITSVLRVGSTLTISPGTRTMFSA